MSQININAQQFSSITNNLNCDHNSFTFILSFLLCSHSASYTLCYAAVAVASAIITFFTTKHVPLGRERDLFFSDHEREIEKKFW